VKNSYYSKKSITCISIKVHIVEKQDAIRINNLNYTNKEEAENPLKSRYNKKSF
jgi:hypothetical protein